MARSIRVTKDTLGPALKRGDERMLAAMYATMGAGASKVQSYARSNAPWTDQTSNARNGLNAQPYRKSDVMGIVLFHTMEYGPWLELRWSGRYAIINPTIRVMGPQVMSSLRVVLGRL